MKRTVFALGMLLVTANAIHAQCKNPVPLVGGQTAIYRGDVLDTPEKLRLALQKPKIQKAFHEILSEAKMADRYDEVIRDLNAMTPQDKRSYPHATEFVWMAMRMRATKQVNLLKHSCWGGPGDLEAWTFVMEIDGTPTTFIAPVACLNLARLPNPVPPPTCTLNATVNCLASDHSKITVTATAQGDATISCNEVKGIKPGGMEVELHRTSVESECELLLDDQDSGTFTFKGTAKSKWPHPVTCETQAAVCVKPPHPACEKPPVCQLEVTGTGTWGEFQIKTGNSTKPSIAVTGPHDKPLAPSSDLKVIAAEEGYYKVTLTATSDDTVCKPAVCSTTFFQPPPPLPCCGSAWLLRGIALGAQAQGAQQNGHVLTASGQPADFELGFGQGLGGGFELERRFSTWSDGGQVPGWGWTLGLWRADLATRWQIDFRSRFLLDHPRVPVTVATTGLNYHLPIQSWDLFIGPLIGYSLFNSGTYPDDSPRAGTFRANFKDTFTYGANVGFDAWLGKCWGVTGGVAYLKFGAKADFLDVNVDPLLVRLGFVYHF